MYCQYLSRTCLPGFLPVVPRGCVRQVGVVHLPFPVLPSGLVWREFFCFSQSVCLKQLLLETCSLLVSWLFWRDGFFPIFHLIHVASLSLVLAVSLAEIFSSQVPRMEARQMLQLHTWLLDVFQC